MGQPKGKKMGAARQPGLAWIATRKLTDFVKIMDEARSPHVMRRPR
jgi:hypothetical protein